MIDSIIDLRIRSQFNYPPPNADKVLDRTIRDGLFFFVTAGINFPGEKSLGEKSLSAEAYAIHKWLCNDAESKEKLGLRLRVFHLMHSLDGAEESLRHINSTYRDSFAAELPPLDVSAVSAAHSALESDWNEAQFNFNRAKKRLTLPGIKELAQVFSVGSVFLLAAGYVHTWFVYDHFGIDANKFFSIGGYLASSINQIVWALYSVVCLVGVVMIRGYRQLQAKNMVTAGLHSAGGLFAYLAEYLLVLILLVVFYKKGTLFFWAFLPMAIYVFFEAPVNSLFNKYVENHFSAKIHLAFLFFFIAGVFASIPIRIEKIKEEKSEEAFVIESVDRTFTSKEHIFLGGNDRYIFLVKKNGGAQVIPLEKVKNMTLFDAESKYPFP
ncbi:MAG: hypothetical protein MPL62_16120 [Alphaproteobacteria bacterium]|nr:hypothetical protein [Alphaproteobacteria bacterium]